MRNIFAIIADIKLFCRKIERSAESSKLQIFFGEVFEIEHEVYIYILVMSAVTLAIKILPLTLIRGEIKNAKLKSFLYYVPYVTLAVMTFPAITYATQDRLSGFLALAVGIISAWLGASLFRVAVLCCLAVFFCELMI